MQPAGMAALFLHFLLLGCMAVGGLNTVMPDMYRYVVDEHGLVTARQFADVYALTQVAPGPNALWVTLVGLQAAGWPGALATTLGVFLPATTLSLAAVVLHARNPESRLAHAVRRGLAPVALGFMFSSVWVLLGPVETGWASYAITVATVVVVTRTRLNPLWLLAAGAAAGIAGLV
jgi:chromate transporter